MTTDNQTSLVAAKEQTISSRRLRAHVIVCHDLDIRSHALYSLLEVGLPAQSINRAVWELANDIIHDANTLITDLQRIRAYAQSQLDKLTPSKP